MNNQLTQEKVKSISTYDLIENKSIIHIINRNKV